ncbi:hypothetical protein J1N35_038330 [Gossypium stocksii]|uniref:Uncharacterized protein n=1 Tax=Gossypium stocksii TaxID=47602 RepID=A0A9D3ULV1_9ROSI|nr:hypothetical protein J1N35_038330 [Gossypium stocksii]
MALPQAAKGYGGYAKRHGIDTTGTRSTHVGRATPTTQGQTSDKGKGVLGGKPPGFPLKEPLLLSSMVESSHMGVQSRASTLDSMGRNSKFECLRFDEGDFRGW